MSATSFPAVGVSAGALMRSALARPEAVVQHSVVPDPMRLATRAFIGLTGVGVFFAITAIATGGESGNPVTLAAVPPLATLLAFPPLYLLTSVRGRSPGIHRLLAVAISGPVIAGVALGASSPLLLLFALTGEIDLAFTLLVTVLTLGAIGAGAVGGLRNSRRAGEGAPGALIVLGHYAFTLWTAAALAVHLV